MLELTAAGFTVLVYFVLAGLAVAIIWLLSANISDIRSRRRKGAENDQQ
ncbi:MAG: hypothetical protein IJG63_08790 [Oscillospiraceae bacterium]|nr:hypothetical protein [Oscillospiraceae bacterium]